MRAPVSPAWVALVSALVALASGFALVASASAAFPEKNKVFPAPGTAANVRHMTLELPAKPGAIACTIRKIYFTEGRYHWEMSQRSWPAYDPQWDSWWDLGPGSVVRLVNGTYTWKDCIKPGFGVNGFYVTQWTSLQGPRAPKAREGFTLWAYGRGTNKVGFGTTLRELPDGKPVGAVGGGLGSALDRDPDKRLMRPE